MNRQILALLAAVAALPVSCADPSMQVQTAASALLDCDAVDPDYPHKRRICHCSAPGDCNYIVIANQGCEAGHTKHASDYDAPNGPSDCAPSACIPKTCADYPDDCQSSLSDGCGGTLDCSNACASPQVCSTGEKRCCTPKTCAELKEADPTFCGLAADGCTDVPLDCSNTCGSGEVCAPSRQCCKPQTCEALQNPADPNALIPCGDLSDFCGGVINCSCSDGKICTQLPYTPGNWCVFPPSP